MKNTHNEDVCVSCRGSKDDLIPLRHDVYMIDGSVHAVPYRLCGECFETGNSDSILTEVEHNYYWDNKPKPIEVKKMLCKLFGIKWKEIGVRNGWCLSVFVPPLLVGCVESWFEENADRLGIPQDYTDMNEVFYRYHVGYHHCALEELYRQADEAGEQVRYELQNR